MSHSLISGTDKVLRVAMFSAEYEPVVGGLGRVVVALSRELARLGHDVHVITSDHPGAPEFEVSHGVNVHRVKNQTDWAPDFFTGVLQNNFGLLQIAMRLHNEKPFDVIHAHDWLVADAAWSLKAACNVPLVSTIHATEQGRNNGVHNDLQRAISQKEWRLIFESDRIIVNSRFMLGEVEWTMHVPSSKVDIIPNAINPYMFVNELPLANLRCKHNLPEGNIVLLVGRMVREKGVHVLLDAAPAVLAKHPNTTFVIAGDGYYLPDLKAQAASLGLNDKVRFFGKANDQQLGELLALTTVATAPSTYEPFGMVALEAMAAGVPLVTSDAGGLVDIVDHLDNGLTSFAGQPESLAWALNEVLGDRELGERLTVNAKKKLAEVYTWSAVTAQTRSVYDKVLATR